MNTVEFLDAIRVRYACSDYKAAQLLGTTRSAVSNYRVGKACFDESVCLRVAELLDLPPEHVLACVNSERTRSAEVRKVWERVAKLTKRAAACLVTGIALSASISAPKTAQAGMTSSDAGLYIMRRKRRPLFGGAAAPA